MKRTLFLLAIVAVITTSCKKEHALSLKTSLAKKYAVHIQIPNFKVSGANFALRTKGGHLGSSSDALTNLPGYIDQFYYVVIDSNFHWVKTIAQDSTMANMGIIDDSLTTGRYIIAGVAGKQGLEVSFGNSTFSQYLFGYASQPWQGMFWTDYPNGYVGLPWQDTFSGGITVIVAPQNNNILLPLNRVVGKLEVTILDDIPANADSLFISVNGPPTATIYWGTGFVGNVTTVYPVAIPASAKGQRNFTIDRIVGNTYSPTFGDNITITCKDAGGNVLGSATATSVAINPNQKTILSGNLFNNSSPQSFTAVIDTAWSSGVTQVGFSLKHH